MPKFRDRAALILLGVVVIVLLVMLVAAIRVVPEHQRLAIFRLGRFLQVAGPGVVFLFPGLDMGVTVDMRVKSQSFDRVTATTNDFSQIAIDVVLDHRIVDPAKSVLEVRRVDTELERVLSTAWRTVIERMLVKEVLANQQTLRAALEATMSELTQPWGIEIVDFKIKNIKRL